MEQLHSTDKQGKAVDTFDFGEMHVEESVERPCCDDDRSMKVEDNISSDATTEEKDSQEENDVNDLTVNDSQQEEATTSFNGLKTRVHENDCQIGGHLWS